MTHVHRRTIGLLALVLPLALVLGTTLGGCGGASAPPASTPAPGAGAEPGGTVAADSTIGHEAAAGAVAGSWRYRFDMIAPANERNAVTDRWVYLWFWPDTTRIWFKLENRQGTPIRILWNDCRFSTADGRVFKVAHEGVPYERCNDALDYTMVAGQQRYNDWLAPVDLLEDPSATQGKGMRLLFPTDASAQGFIGKTFGASFVLEIEGTPRPYDLLFKVVSVIPPS